MQKQHARQVLPRGAWRTRVIYQRNIYFKDRKRKDKETNKNSGKTKQTLTRSLAHRPRADTLGPWPRWASCANAPSTSRSCFLRHWFFVSIVVVMFAPWFEYMSMDFWTQFAWFWVQFSTFCSFILPASTRHCFAMRSVDLCLNLYLYISSLRHQTTNRRFLVHTHRMRMRDQIQGSGLSENTSFHRCCVLFWTDFGMQHLHVFY